MFQKFPQATIAITHIEPQQQKLYIIATVLWRNFWFYVYIHMHTLPYTRIPQDTRTLPATRLLQKQNAFSVHLKFWTSEMKSSAILSLSSSWTTLILGVNQEAPASAGAKSTRSSLMSPPPKSNRHTEALHCVENPFCYFFFFLQMFALCRRLTIPSGIYYNRPSSKVSYHQCCNKCRLLLPVLSLPATVFFANPFSRTRICSYF